MAGTTSWPISWINFLLRLRAHGAELAERWDAPHGINVCDITRDEGHHTRYAVVEYDDPYRFVPLSQAHSICRNLNIRPADVGIPPEN